MTLPDMTAQLAEQTKNQGLDRRRPLLIVDADEVLLQFVVCFEAFLSSRGLYLDLKSYALFGNVRRLRDEAALSRDTVARLIEDFFHERAQDIPPVAGAADALSGLWARAQIVVLSNIPADQRLARRRGLAHHGMDYPVLVNVGPKGGAVAALARLVAAPVLFIDDVPRNIASVARAAGHVRRIHFVADPRLAALIAPAPDSHARIDHWPEARCYIEDWLSAGGF